MDLIYRYDPFQPVQLRLPRDGEAARAELQQGNARVVEIMTRMQASTAGAPSGEPLVIPVSPVSLGLPLVPGGAPVQSPFALVVGCSDARAPIEAIFDQSFNSIFVVRVAGNVLGTECLGSVNYAVRNLQHSLKLIVALGHSECGAVTAAVDAYLAPESFADIAFTYALRSLVDRMQISVRGAAKALREAHGATVSGRSGYRIALRNLAVYLNAAMTAFELRRELRMDGENQLEVVFAVFDLASVTVRAHPTGMPGDWPATKVTFAQPPSSAEDFGALAIRWAQSAEITTALDS
jgi:carbonic anhydrase